MSDLPLPGLCLGPFVAYTGKSGGGYGYVIPTGSPTGNMYLVDILTVTARRNTGDDWCNAIVYLGDDDVPDMHPVAGATATADSAEDLASTEVFTWVSQAPFYMPLPGPFGLILGVDHAGVSGASWGACYIAGRVFSALN